MKKLLAVLIALILIPGTIAFAERIPMLRAGGSFTYAVDANGVIRGWGDSRNGQLGYTRAKLVPSPKLVAEGLDGNLISDLRCGNENTLFLMADGSVFTTGSCDHGTQGVGKLSSHVLTPIQIPNLHEINAVDCGFGHNLALDRDGHVWAWGRNDCGQVGNNTRKDVLSPVQLPLDNIVQISCGGKFSLALDQDGTLWGWGSNEYGVLGQQAKIVREPVRIDAAAGLSIAQFSGGGDCVFLLDTDGVLWAWGRNDYRQLGTTQNVGKSTITPVRVEIPERISRIIAYSSHVMAIDEHRNAWIWGNTTAGQLGNGKSTTPREPVCTWTKGNIADAAIGSLFCAILTDDGEVYATGYNKYGQLGNNYPSSSSYWGPVGLNLISGTLHPL